MTTAAIVSTPDSCGGHARVDGTRVPVWLLVLHQQSGLSSEVILKNYPSLTSADLDAAWEYYRRNSLEIDRAIWWQETAGNIPAGGPVPMNVIVEGILLGVEEDQLRDAFEPKLSREQVAEAWADYRLVPIPSRRSLLTHSRAG